MWPILFGLGAEAGLLLVSQTHSWAWPMVFGLGTALFLALMRIFVHFMVVRIFGSPAAYRTFLRERRISRRLP